MTFTGMRPSILFMMARSSMTSDSPPILLPRMLASYILDRLWLDDGQVSPDLWLMALHPVIWVMLPNHLSLDFINCALVWRHSDFWGIKILFLPSILVDLNYSSCRFLSNLVKLTKSRTWRAVPSLTSPLVTTSRVGNFYEIHFTWTKVVCGQSSDTGIMVVRISG